MISNVLHDVTWNILDNNSELVISGHSSFSATAPVGARNLLSRS